MRLMQTIAGGAVGGAEEFFVRLARAFEDAGIDQRIVMRSNDRRLAALRAASVDVAVARFGGPLDFTTARTLDREIAAFTPDIVLSWMSRAARVTGAVRRRRDFVHAARLGGYYKLKYYRHCDHLIGNTPDIVDYMIREGWPSTRAHFVPNFVDAGTAPPADRAALDTPADAPVLLALGRLHANKAFDVLIAALARLPGAYLWLAGEGPLRGELQRQAQSDGVAARVRFLGWRDDVAALMAAATVLVCPSRIEPLGNVVIEGWARGLPVVAAASAGPAWLIEPGRTGLLVPVDDPVELAGAIGRAIGDTALSAVLAEGGRAAYRARFTEAAVVAAYRELFGRMLDECAA